MAVDVHVVVMTPNAIAALGWNSLTGMGLNIQTAASAKEALDLVGNTNQSVLLWDDLAGLSVPLISDIVNTAPHANIVLWISELKFQLAFQAMAAGIRGILRKSLPLERQLECLKKVGANQVWFEKNFTDSFQTAKRVVLTQREGQLITLLTQGLKDKEIASTLEISNGTVRVYLSQLFQKVGARDRFELALFGLSNLTNVPGQHAPAPSNGKPIPGLHILVVEPSLDFLPSKQPDIRRVS